MKVYISADHRGFDLKIILTNFLSALDHDVENLGSQELVLDDDYPDAAFAVAEAVAKNIASRGIIICASGAGVDIAANKVKTIRCGLGLSVEQVKAARRDDNINCLALAADFVSQNEIKEMAIAFLDTPYEDQDKHNRRLTKITQYENTRY